MRMAWPNPVNVCTRTQHLTFFSAGKLVCSIDGPKLGFGHFANLSCFTTFAALATAFATFATFAATFATFVAFLSAFGRLFCLDFSKLFATGPLVPVANVTGVLAHHLLLKSIMTTWKHQFNNSMNDMASFLKLHTSLEPWTTISKRMLAVFHVMIWSHPTETHHFQVDISGTGISEYRVW